MIRGWCSLSQNEPATTAAEVRRRLSALQRERGQTISARDALALTAMQSDAAAQRYQELDELARELGRRVQLLGAALPQAEARETEAAAQALALETAKRIADFDCATDEARRWLLPILERLVTADELTRARDLRDQLARDGRRLADVLDDVRFRRPLDPFFEIYKSLKLRVDRIWSVRGTSKRPIKL